MQNHDVEKSRTRRSPVRVLILIESLGLLAFGLFAGGLFPGAGGMKVDVQGRSLIFFILFQLTVFFYNSAFTYSWNKGGFANSFVGLLGGNVSKNNNYLSEMFSWCIERIKDLDAKTPSMKKSKGKPVGFLLWVVSVGLRIVFRILGQFIGAHFLLLSLWIAVLVGFDSVRGVLYEHRGFVGNMVSGGFLICVVVYGYEAILEIDQADDSPTAAKQFVAPSLLAFANLSLIAGVMLEYARHGKMEIVYFFLGQQFCFGLLLVFVSHAGKGVGVKDIGVHSDTSA